MFFSEKESVKGARLNSSYLRNYFLQMALIGFDRKNQEKMTQNNYYGIILDR